MFTNRMIGKKPVQNLLWVHVLHFLIAYLFRDKPVILMQYMVNACSLKALISVNTWIQEVTLLLCILKILESLVVIILQVSNQLP